MVMRVRDLLKEEIDVDVVDNYDERCYIAFCGAVTLTEEGEKQFEDAMDIIVVPQGYDRDTWVLVCDTWKEAEACKELFYSLAGFCSASDWDKWFVE